MPVNPVAESLVRKLEDMRSQRSPFEQDWRDIRDLIRPVTGEINPYNQFYTPARRSEKVYDSTAVDACEEFASGLHSYLTNPVERWFSLEVDAEPELMRDPDVLGWLEVTADAIYGYYNQETASLNCALHEAYLDIGAYGSAVVNQEWSDKYNGLVFRAMPIQSCWFDEDSDGHVDTTFRTIPMTLRQVEQKFKFSTPEMKKKRPDTRFQILHAVFPRVDRRMFKLDAGNMPVASIWLCVDTKELLRESGYRTFPYHSPRWTKIAGEVWGRSPAMVCLADVKLLNAMDRTIMKAAEKIVDPPLQVPDDGFLTPIKTSPGALLYKEPGAENIEPLLIGANIPVGLELTEQKRQFIRKAFHTDWLRMEKEKIEMTAYEVADRREEKLRLLAPQLGRLETELLGPMIARTYQLLTDRQRLPGSPDVLIGKNIKVSYNSPASKAQMGIKALAMGRYVQELIPLAQIDPSILDAVHMDNYARELAISRGVTRLILRSDEEIAQIRQQRQAAQAAQQMADIAEPATKSIKNLADANSKGNLGSLGL